MARLAFHHSKSLAFVLVLSLVLLCSVRHSTHAAGVLTCACNTNECQTQGRSRCQANNMCYIQFLPAVDDGDGGEPDVIQGCIDDATPLLCETGSFGAMMMMMPKLPSAAAAAGRTARRMWPSLTCCAQDMCNTKQKQEQQKSPPPTIAQQQQESHSPHANVPSPTNNHNNNMEASKPQQQQPRPISTPYERHHMLIYSGRKGKPVVGMANNIIPAPSSIVNNNRGSSSSSSAAILTSLLDQRRLDYNNGKKPIQIDTGDDIDAQTQLDLAAAGIIIKTSSVITNERAAVVPPIPPTTTFSAAIVPDEIGFADGGSDNGDRRQQRTYLFGVNPVYIVAPALACAMIMVMAFLALFMIKSNQLCPTGSTSSWPSSNSFHGGYTSSSRARSKLRRLSSGGGTLRGGLTLGVGGNTFTLGPYNQHSPHHGGSPTQQQHQLQHHYSNAPTGVCDNAYNVGSNNPYTSSHRTSTYLNNHRQIFDTTSAVKTNAEGSW